MDLKNAIINYKKALKIDSKYFDALFNLAITYKENKNISKQLNIIKKL